MPLHDVLAEERLLRELGSRKRELGESLRHQRAAMQEPAAIFHWRARAENFVRDRLGLDAIDDAEACAHAVYVLAGRYRETVEQAIAECEREFLATREAGGL